LRSDDQSPVVKLSVQNQEDRIYQAPVRTKLISFGDRLTVINERSNDLSLGPFCTGIELLGELVPPVFIAGRDLRQVVIDDRLMKLNYKL